MPVIKSLLSRWAAVVAMVVYLIVALPFSLRTSAPVLSTVGVALIALQVPALLLERRLRTGWLPAVLVSAYCIVSVAQEKAKLGMASRRMTTVFEIIAFAFALLALEEGIRALIQRSKVKSGA
jgi:hypothetical protein